MPRKFFPVYEPYITRDEERYVLRAVRSGWISSLGEFITRFEREFAEFVGVKFALTTSNGTSALHLALVSCGISEGDEVIVPDLTFVATANAVVYSGAKPVFADIDPETWCISPEDIRRKITKKTKAIIPVHIYGHPADMDAINEIAHEFGLIVIEDCAEAHGAKYKGRVVGSLGTCGAFSFYGNKIITTGEGGMITTNDEKIYNRAKFLRDHAMSKEKRYWHTEIGFNYRMTNIQAAVGTAQLKKIKYIIRKKRMIFSWYREFLHELVDSGAISLNPEKSWAENVFWMICVVVNKIENEEKREILMKELKSKGIDTRPFFYPLSILPHFSEREKTKMREKSRNSVALSLYYKGLNLPSSPNLSKDDVEYICKELIRTLRKLNLA